MVHSCKKCSENDSLQEYLKTLLEESFNNGKNNLLIENGEEIFQLL